MLLLATGAFLLAGTIKGAVGLGLPTASVGIMTQFIDPVLAIVLVILPAMVANAWQLWQAGDAVRAFRDYRVLAISLMVVIFLTTFLTASVEKDTLLLIVGIAVVIFALTSLLVSPPRLPDRFDKPAQLVAGVASGVLGGLTSIWSPPMVTYLISRRLEKDEFVRVTGLLIFAGTVPLALGFWRAGFFTAESATVSAAMIVPSLIGFQLGAMIRRRIDASKFGMVLLVVFLLMGLNIVRRALW